MGSMCTPCCSQKDNSRKRYKRNSIVRNNIEKGLYKNQRQQTGHRSKQGNPNKKQQSRQQSRQKSRQKQYATFSVQVKSNGSVKKAKQSSPINRQSPKANLDSSKKLLNSQFQNSVSSSNTDSSPSNQIDRSYQKKQGLPNVGNTCYLNSILQMLYSASRFRKTVIKLSMIKPTLELHRLLTNIFNDISDESEKKTKEQHLRDLIKYLQRLNHRFALFQQNDALECLLQILNSLQEEDPQNSKLKYFRIEYELHCKCTEKNNAPLLSCYFVKSSQICSTCKRQIQYLIHNSSTYLIAMPPNNFKFRSKIKYVSKYGKDVLYENKSFITYFGTGVSGHYISHRKTQKGWIKLNDSSVEFVGKIKKLKTPPKLTLYEFIPDKR